MTAAPRSGTSSGPSFANALAYYAMVADGVVALKDYSGGSCGPLMGGFWYEGIDHENASSEDLNALIRHANHALSKFGQGWMVHFQCMRSERQDYRLGQFRAPVDRLIDEGLGEVGRFWHDECAVFVTYAPPLGLGTKGTPESILADMMRRVQEFERALDGFAKNVSRVATLKRMRLSDGGTHDELLSALNFIVNGRRHEVRPPRNPTHLDAMLARDLLMSARKFAHGEDCVAVLGVSEFPAELAPGAISQLKTLNVAYRLSARFIFLDAFAAERKLERLQSKWSQMTTLLKQARVSGSADLHAEERAEEIPFALKKLRDGHLRYGHYTFNVILRGRTQEEANQKAEAVKARLEEMRFVPILETMNRMAAFLGSLPGHGRENVRRPLISTENLGTLCDFDRPWPGDPECQNKMMPRAGPLMRVRNWQGGSFDLNLHQGQVGHTLVLGMTGSGKTTLVAHLCSQFLRYPGARVIALDHGEGLLPITLARSDGAHFALGDREGPQLCPLAELESQEDIDWACQWVEMLCALQGLAMREVSKYVRRAVHELAQVPKGLGTGRRLTDLVPHLQSDELESVMEAYTMGIGARILNGEQTTVTAGQITTFEVGRLLSLDIKVAAPTLTFLFRTIEKMLNGEPRMIVLSEAWLPLSHPQCYPFVQRLLNTARKSNAFLLMDTQYIDQVAESPIAGAVFSACPTRILFAGASTDTVRDMYRTKLGLSEQQIADLQNLAPASAASRRWCLFSQGERSRLFTLDLSRSGHAFCAANKPQVEAIKRLARERGAAWPAHWLEECGHPDLARRFAQLEGI